VTVCIPAPHDGDADEAAHSPWTAKDRATGSQATPKLFVATQESFPSGLLSNDFNADLVVSSRCSVGYVHGALGFMQPRLHANCSLSGDPPNPKTAGALAWTLRSIVGEGNGFVRYQTLSSRLLCAAASFRVVEVSRKGGHSGWPGFDLPDRFFRQSELFSRLRSRRQLLKRMKDTERKMIP